jgi:hypothetical protein
MDNTYQKVIKLPLTPFKTDLALHSLVWLINNAMDFPDTWHSLHRMADTHEFNERSIFNFIILPVNTLSATMTTCLSSAGTDPSHSSKPEIKAKRYYANRALLEYTTDYANGQGGFESRKMSTGQRGKNADVAAIYQKGQGRISPTTDLGACYQLYAFYVMQQKDHTTSDIEFTKISGVVKNKDELPSLLKFEPRNCLMLSPFVKNKFAEATPITVTFVKDDGTTKRKAKALPNKRAKRAKKSHGDDTATFSTILSSLYRLGSSDEPRETRIKTLESLGQQLTSIHSFRFNDRDMTVDLTGEHELNVTVAGDDEEIADDSMKVKILTQV